MIWTDRIAVGVAGLAIIATALIFVSSDAPQREAEYKATAIDCSKAPHVDRNKPVNEMTDDEILWAFSKPCDPVENAAMAARMRAPTAYDYAIGFGKFGLYALLPLWLALRIVDFVIGGPQRRSRGSKAPVAQVG